MGKHDGEAEDRGYRTGESEERPHRAGEEQRFSLPLAGSSTILDTRGMSDDGDNNSLRPSRQRTHSPETVLE